MNKKNTSRVLELISNGRMIRGRFGVFHDEEIGALEFALDEFKKSTKIDESSRELIKKLHQECKHGVEFE